MSSRSNPFERIERMFEQVSRQLEDAAREWDGERFQLGETGASRMGIDLADRGDEFVVTVDVPGFEKDEIELRLANGTLFLEATKEQTAEEREETYLRQERTQRSLHKRVQLPEPVKEDAIEASLTNGVLTVRIPKAEPSEAGGHRIEIE